MTYPKESTITTLFLNALTVNIASVQLITFDLVKVEFKYDSLRDWIHFTSIHTNGQMSDEDVTKNIKIFVTHLRTNVFPGIKERYGDFSVLIQCNATSGVTGRGELYNSPTIN